jgi:antitoxin HigA-1
LTVTFNLVVHPGSILGDELADRTVSAAELARQIAVPANRISQIIAGKRSISGDTALRLGHWFGMEPQFWMNLQTQHDLALARRDMGADLEKLPTIAA